MGKKMPHWHTNNNKRIKEIIYYCSEWTKNENLWVLELKFVGVSVHGSGICLCVSTLLVVILCPDGVIPHPLLSLIPSLVSRRKSQTLTLNLRTIWRVAIEICIDAKSVCARGNQSQACFRADVPRCCRLQQCSALRFTHCLDFKWLLGW